MYRSRVDLIALAIIGLAIQAFWVALSRQPSYMDAYYYAVGGQRLAGGHGFTVPVIWQYLDEPAGLPAPSHTYWMPLPSILASAGYWFTGNYFGARIPFWFLGGILPLLAVIISGQLQAKRWQSWAAGLFTAAGGFYASFFGQTTTFAPFAWAAGGGLLTMTLALRAPTAAKARLWLLVTGLAVGLAHLTRADGVLLLIVVVGLGVWSSFRSQSARKGGGERAMQKVGASDVQRPLVFMELLFLLPGYLLVMGPWFVRNLSLFGRPLFGGGFQSIFLTTYDDLFAFGRDITAADFIAWGFSNILRSRFDGLWVAIQTMVAVPGLIFLAPFVIIALWRLMKRPSTRAVLWPVLLFGAAIFLNSSLLFTFPGIRGTLFHGSVALWPWSMALAPIGITLVVEWISRRLPHWRPERASPNFTFMFVGVALLLSLYVSVQRVAPVDKDDLLVEIGQSLPESAVVMTGDAPAFYFHTGLPSVNVPNEPLEVLLKVGDRYGVTHLLLDQNRPLPLESIYAGRQNHPRLLMMDTIGDIKIYEIASNS